MPMYPVSADAMPPTRNASATGTPSVNQITAASTTATPATVLYCRLRYAIDPSWIAFEISTISGLPCGCFFSHIARNALYMIAIATGTKINMYDMFLLLDFYIAISSLSSASGAAIWSLSQPPHQPIRPLPLPLLLPAAPANEHRSSNPSASPPAARSDRPFRLPNSAGFRERTRALRAAGESPPSNLCRRERIRDKLFRIFRPFRDIDLLVAKFVVDRHHARAALTNKRSHWIHSFGL